MSLFSLLPLILALGVSLAGASWLFVRRHRFRRRPVTRPACRACRHEIEQRRERCPECGADLDRRGLVDADWPRRGAWILRGIAILALVLPVPFVATGPLERWMPWQVDETAVVTVGIANEAGVVQPVIRRARRSSQWLPPSVANPPPAPPGGGPPRTPGPQPTAPAIIDTWAHPVEASDDFLSAEARDRARLAADPVGPDFRRIPAMASDASPSTAEAADLAQRCLEDPSIGSSVAGRTRAVQSSGGSTDSYESTRVVDALRVFEWRYAALPPGSVVPLEIATVTVKRTLAPSPARFPEVAMVALVLAAGWTIVVARRFRRVSPDAAFEDGSV